MLAQKIELSAQGLEDASTVQLRFNNEREKVSVLRLIRVWLPQDAQLNEQNCGHILTE